MARYFSIFSVFILIEIGTVAYCANQSCPTWLYQTKEGWCSCGSSLTNVLICNNISQEVGIQNSFCLTSFDEEHFLNKPVVGRCLFAQIHEKSFEGNVGLFVKVDKNLSQQSHQLCGYLNRKGRLCGDCEKDHFCSAYSYDLKCYQCKRGLFNNIILYLTVAYVPLTLFLGIVMFFHISVAAPHLNVTVLLCQFYVAPAGLQVLIQVTRNTHIVIPIYFIATIYGVWNLDFFRTFIPPICLPLTTLQVIALDYLVAIYPLLLLICFYVLVTFHDKGCKPLIEWSKPFLWCAKRIRNQWNVRNSIIEAFSTFLLLSYVKFVTISSLLVVPTRVFDVHGTSLGHYMYYDATVEFMGRKHLPFFIPAVTVLFLALLFPLLLLLYPMRRFQVFLNNYHLNSPGLRIFMDTFQGYYRDRTDGGWECRYFAALYPTLRILGGIMYALTRTDVVFPFIIILVVFVILILFIVRPYKEKFQIYHKLDLFFLLSLIMFCSGFIVSFFFFDWDEINPVFGYALGGLVSLVPFFYFAWCIIRYIFKEKTISISLKHVLSSLHHYNSLGPMTQICVKTLRNTHVKRYR